MALDFAATYKVLVLGDSNVGKTCIVHRYCDERYYDTYISTIGIDFKQKIINLDGTPIKLQIWDTAGQERFRTLTTAYYRGAMGILLMYDVTSLESFNHLSYWLRNIQENASPDVVKVLAANKCDATAHRAVDAERGQKIAENFDMPFFEVSCKENINIEEAFLTLARRIREQRGRRVRLIRVKSHLLLRLNKVTPGDAAVSSVDDHRRSSRPVGSFDGSQELNPGTKDFVCSSCTKGESVVSIPVHTQRDRESVVE